jgi:hypothetical protein
MLINSVGAGYKAYNITNYAIREQNPQTELSKSRPLNTESTVKISPEARMKQSQEDVDWFYIDDMFNDDELKEFEKIGFLTGDTESTNRLKGLLGLEKHAAKKREQIEPKLDVDYIQDLIKKAGTSDSYFGMDLNYLQSAREYFT